MVLRDPSIVERSPALCLRTSQRTLVGSPKAFVLRERDDLQVGVFDLYTQARGVSKSDLVESALRHHLQALYDLPANVIIPPRVVVSRKSGERILARIKKPPKPTAAMKALGTHGRSAPARNGEH